MKDINETNIRIHFKKLKKGTLRHVDEYSSSIVSEFHRKQNINKICFFTTFLALLTLFTIPISNINMIKSDKAFAMTIGPIDGIYASSIRVRLPASIDFLSNSYPEIEELSQINIQLNGVNTVTAISVLNGPSTIFVDYLNNDRVVLTKRMKFWFY